MTLTVPGYIRLAEIQSKIIRYKWDDWDVEVAEEPIDEDLLSRLQKVSQRASAAFGVASAEWIIFRFARLMDYEEPFWYLEAAWAQIIDARYGLEWDPLQAGWEGPVMGPIRQALMWVGDAIEQVDDDLEPAESGATLARLSEYVLPIPDAYHFWCHQALARLEKFFPLDEKDSKGDVVPREVMDPSFDFRVNAIEHLVNSYLSRLDREDNPFLNSPEGMVEQGFKGTPYVFKISEDRQDRLDW